jgi:hypothetical protein
MYGGFGHYVVFLGGNFSVFRFLNAVKAEIM